MSVNRVILVGNLGADPELRTVGNDRSVCNLSIATSESFKDKDGQRQERTEWHRVTVWGEQADVCAKYLEKGRMVYVEGKLQTRKYEKDGVTKYATDVVAEKVTFLGGGNGQRREGGSSGADKPARGGRWGGDVGAAGSPQEREPGADDIPL